MPFSSIQNYATEIDRDKTFNESTGNALGNLAQTIINETDQSMNIPTFSNNNSKDES